jgi:anti-sigma28 factor (negative regulator of flagellin synthesis)
MKQKSISRGLAALRPLLFAAGWMLLASAPSAGEEAAVPVENAGPAKAPAISPETPPVRSRVFFPPSPVMSTGPTEPVGKGASAGVENPAVKRLERTEFVEEKAFGENRKNQKQSAQETERLVREQIERIHEAIADGKLENAALQLEFLRKLLPDESVTLLRMRAWFALSSGQDEEARRLYRQLLYRLGGDENSGINLVALEARLGRNEEAARILSDLAISLPDSSKIRELKRAFSEDGPRPSSTP